MPTDPLWQPPSGSARFSSRTLSDRFGESNSRSPETKKPQQVDSGHRPAVTVTDALDAPASTDDSGGYVEGGGASNTNECESMLPRRLRADAEAEIAFNVAGRGDMALGAVRISYFRSLARNPLLPRSEEKYTLAPTAPGEKRMSCGSTK